MLSGITGEARLLEITGIVNTDVVLVDGRRIETPAGSVVADGTQQYSITAAGSAPSLAGRQTLYPPTNMPQVIYLGDDVGESALFEALTDGRIDAIARGEIGNRDTAAATHGTFVVTALDDQVEYGGFTIAAHQLTFASITTSSVEAKAVSAICSDVYTSATRLRCPCRYGFTLVNLRFQIHSHPTTKSSLPDCCLRLCFHRVKNAHY